MYINMEANATYQMNKDLHLVIATTTTLEMVMKHTVVVMEVQGKFHMQLEEYSGAASKEFADFTKLDMVTKKLDMVTKTGNDFFLL